MNGLMEEIMVRERVREALAQAAHQRLVASLRPARTSMRRSLGMALIRAGRWVAGQAPRGAGEPDRAAV